MDPVFSKERERAFAEALLDGTTTIRIVKDYLELCEESGPLGTHLIKMLGNTSAKMEQILASPRPVTMDS